MSRYWGGGTGIIEPVPYKLDKDSRVFIRNNLKSERKIRLDDDQIGTLYLKIERAISLYLGAEKLRDSCKPAKIRSELAGALKTLHKMEDQLFDMNMNSKMLLSEASRKLSYELRAKYIDELHESLELALNLAEEYPKKGKLPQDHRMFLAEDLARVSQEIGVKPTTTKGGWYESLLSVVFEIVTGKTLSNPHELARSALARLKESETWDKKVANTRKPFN